MSVFIQTNSENLYFRQLIKDAAKRVIDDHNGQRIDLAISNLKNIINYGQSFQSKPISHKEFVRALSGLCPMWPFC